MRCLIRLIANLLLLLELAQSGRLEDEVRKRSQRERSRERGDAEWATSWAPWKSTRVALSTN